MKIIIFLLLLSSAVFAQYPGYFYAFELKDESGNFITGDKAKTDYKVTLTSCSECSDEIVMGIRICDDNKTWRYYAGGNYQYLDKTNTLTIERLSNGTAAKTMVINFPAALSKGENKTYMNLYTGTIEFQNGTYTIILPETKGEWESLQQLKLCPDDVNENYTFGDISKYQK